MKSFCGCFTDRGMLHVFTKRAPVRRRQKLMGIMMKVPGKIFHKIGENSIFYKKYGSR
jgi:hypothetical protein